MALVISIRAFNPLSCSKCYGLSATGTLGFLGGLTDLLPEAAGAFSA
jgi:hypothetical protein